MERISDEQFIARYAMLNQAQKQAVDTIDGPVMVIAGPGSGKTELLSLRAANIMRIADIHPRNILCLTFTDAAAVNMRERLAGIIGPDAHQVEIHTFHSFASSIMGRFRETFAEVRERTVASEVVQLDILGDVLAELPLSNPLGKQNADGYIFMNSIKSRISECKRAGMTPADLRRVLAANAAVYDAASELVLPVFAERMSKKVFSSVGQLIDELGAIRHCEERGTSDAAISAGTRKRLPRSLSVARNDEVGVGDCRVDSASASSPRNDRTTLNIPGYQPFVQVLRESLSRALADAETDDSTKPLTAWKKDWIKKDDNTGEPILKAVHAHERLVHLADIYDTYRNALAEAGYADFDDLILDVLTTVRARKGILASLQEQYQYVMVDEFQDTNDAQMGLVQLITDAAANEGKPNVMVVGDDDQAIYKFQGAELSNILTFRDRYTDVATITLTKNYRSVPEIVGLARTLIQQGEERLENLTEDLEKKLEAAHPEMTSGEIVSLSFDDALHEQVYVMSEIKKLLGAGTSPEDIAIIARNHKHLEAISPILSDQNIPVTYERETNVLDEPHITQLVTCLQFISSLAEDLTHPAQQLLPEIVQYPFWGVERQDVWRLSLAARKAEGGWMTAMLESDNAQFVTMANFFLALAGKAQSEPVERIIDALVGGMSVDLGASKNVRHCEERGTSDEAILDGTRKRLPRLRSATARNDEIEKSYTKASTKRSLDSLAVARDDVKGDSDAGFVSPFRAYYFGADRFQNQRAEYLTFLSSLRTFIDTIRSYRRDMTRPALLADAMRALDIYEEHGVSMHDTSALRSGANAVTLLTAHKAKGLEYETVFVLSCQEDVWGKSKRGSNLPLPQNMRISPAGDTRDDMLRLFFVAITRAKRTLYMTHYQSKNGKLSSRLSFLDHNSLDAHAATHTAVDDAEALGGLESALADAPLILAGEEKALLLPLVEGYKMPVTHLSNFLDIMRGGPQHFLETNLLRFPQPLSDNAAYGTAMHAAAEFVVLQKKLGTPPSLEETVAHFEQALLKSGLNSEGFEKQREEAVRVLAMYHPFLLEHTHEDDHVELDFSLQAVLIGNAHITGKIDRLVTKDDVATVFDVKTGKAHREWKPKTDTEKVQFHNYKRQLTFYKLLVERSRDYHQLNVNSGVIEYASLKGSKEIIRLPYSITDADVTRLEALIEAVYTKIINLEFPDVSEFPETYAGMVAFEDWLLEQ